MKPVVSISVSLNTAKTLPVVNWSVQLD